MSRGKLSGAYIAVGDLEKLPRSQFRLPGNHFCPAIAAIVSLLAYQKCVRKCASRSIEAIAGKRAS